MKNIELEIDDTVWQYELDKFNKVEQDKITNANISNLEHHTALMAHTPEKLRTKFSPAPDFVPLTIEDYVIKILTEKEMSITTSRTSDHLAVLAQQSPDTIARFAKVTELSDKIKEKLAAQVDAL